MDGWLYILIYLKTREKVKKGWDLWTYYIGNEGDEGDSVSQLPCPCKGSTKRSGGIRAFGCKEGMGIYKQWAYTCPSTKENSTLNTDSFTNPKLQLLCHAQNQSTHSLIKSKFQSEIANKQENIRDQHRNSLEQFSQIVVRVYFGGDFAFFSMRTWIWKLCGFDTQS